MQGSVLQALWLVAQLLWKHILHAQTALEQQLFKNVMCFADKPARQGSVPSIGFLDARNQSP